MARENYLLGLSMLEQEANKLQEQLQIVNQQVLELETLKLSLDKLKGGEEILANLGRGVFVKSELKDKDLFVNVGSGIVLKKSPENTTEIIQNQIKQLEDIKENLNKSIGDLNAQVQDLVIKAQNENAEKKDN